MCMIVSICVLFLQGVVFCSLQTVCVCDSETVYSLHFAAFTFLSTVDCPEWRGMVSQTLLLSTVLYRLS